jgi:Zn-dependent protease with chaperone function
VNFFEQQQRSRRYTVIAVLLFILATLVVVAITDLAILAMLTIINTDPYLPPRAYYAWAGQHPEAVLWSSVTVAVLVGGASLFRIFSLAGGGGTLARSLGGTLVDTGTGDPQKRQLLNIVEEMAIASGVPVPDVYVLENEGGINAFAAGFGISDAAIVVTRGSLEVLTRDELQGVVAHEFSHVLNGDMRLNTRLVGVTFGILVIALVGRTILRGVTTRRGRVGRDAGKAVLLILLLGVALAAVGYIGVLLTRWIKAIVSRQRESLADASAVQFTRNPHGIAGALKKIAVSPLRAVISGADTEEVSHMLLAEKSSLLTQMFATHPPILERIRALEPSFDPSELDEIRLAPRVQTPPPPVEKPPTPAQEAAWLPLSVIAAIGNPGSAALGAAHQHHDNLPSALRDAAHSPTDALALVLTLILSPDPPVRERQHARIRERVRMTPENEQRMKSIEDMILRLDPALRVPLLEICFPALRHRPETQLRTLVSLVGELVAMDASLTVLDYVLARLIRIHLAEALAPQGPASITRRPKLIARTEELQTLFSVVARAGTDDGQDAAHAFDAGIHQLLPNVALRYVPIEHWVEPLDRALTRLDVLLPMVKQELIKALVTTVSRDGKLTLGESELLRLVCASLHCPVPPLLSAAEPD